MNYLYIEWLCLKQHFYFSLRNRRYLFIAIAQYLYFFRSPRRSYQLRLVYCTLQLVDDIVDGDRKFKFNPNEYIENLLKDKHFNNANHDLKVLYLASIKRINSKFLQKDEALLKFKRLICTMLFDYNRVKNKIILSKKELIEHHHKTFSDSLDIVLMALDSKLRTSDVPTILDIFAWCSTIRDLEEDIQKGLINIPSDIVFSIPNFYSLKITEITNNSKIVAFLNTWTKEVEGIYPKAYQEYELIKNESGASIVKLFLNSMKKYLRYG